jgi:hypothetical protein
MKKALAGVLAVAFVGCIMAGAAVAQVPYVQVYFDAAFTETQSACQNQPGGSGPPVELHVVYINWNMNMAEVEFSISYPASLIYLGDNLVDPDTQAKIGDTPSGIAVATANCCPFNGFAPVEVLRPLVLWGQCDCLQGPQSLVVGGYTAFGKIKPSAVRKEDFVEFEGVGMTSLICPGPIATEQSTWGQVKALYR